MRSRFVTIILVALTARMAMAEENCGSMVRRAVRFRGTIRSVEPIGRRQLTVNAVDSDVQFVIEAGVDGVTPGNTVLHNGARHFFGVHSPARLLGLKNAVGTTVPLEAEVMECDGQFRRFVHLRKPDGRVENPGWSLEVGHIYRAKVRWHDAELEVVTPINGPMHHAIGMHFVNADVVPRGSRVRFIRFEVLSVHTDYVREREWLSIYELKIIPH